MNTHFVNPPTADQQRASDPNASIWVAASAGSGKTKVLVDRVLALLIGGVQPTRILCLTFTKAAATEMAIRVNEKLGQWVTSDEDDLSSTIEALKGTLPDEREMGRARRLLAQVLDTPGGLKILTIHSFCESLLARFPLEAGISPNFEVMDDRRAAELLVDARNKVLESVGEDGDIQSNLTRALATVTQHVREDEFSELMLLLTRERSLLKEIFDKPTGIDGAINKIFEQLNADMSSGEQVLITEACDDKAFDKVGLKEIVSNLAKGSHKSDRLLGSSIDKWICASPSARVRNFESYTKRFLTKLFEPRARLITKDLGKAEPVTKAILMEEATRLAQFKEQYQAQVTAQASASLLRLGEAFLQVYETEKAKLALLDYDDLILIAQQLLEQPGIAPWVLYKLDGGLDHILIDEAQDTNPEQWRVVAALANDFFTGEDVHSMPRTIFAVGDMKQSIFSFQRADPAAFLRMREYFASQVMVSQNNWKEVSLNLSFRSTEAVLTVIDSIFKKPDAADGVSELGHDLRHQAVRKGHAGLVEVWPLAAPKDMSKEKPWTLPIINRPQDSPRTRLAKVIARRIKGWIGKEVLKSRDRPVRAGDIIVLVRRRGVFVEELVRALKDLRIAVSGVDRMVLTEQLAVMDLMVLGNFLLLPEDDMTLATVLKGPFIGFNDDDLFHLAWGRNKMSLWHCLGERAAEDSRCADARQWLESLLTRADVTPPFELFSQVLTSPAADERNGRASMIARLGADAGDAINEFLNLAIVYGQAHIPSLQGFLNWVKSGRTEVKRDLEQSGRDEVRVMTVHGAKGLEAPIVILPDTASVPATHSPQILWHQGLPFWPPRRGFEEPFCRSVREVANKARDQEYRRLLYVAMSRAEDRLYVCGWQGVKKLPQKCWYDLIVRGLASVTDVKKFSFQENGDIGWSGEGLRYVGKQLVPANHDGRGLDESKHHVELLPWMLEYPEVETSSSNPLVPSRATEDQSVVGSPLDIDGKTRFQRGKLIHRLLEILPTLPKQRQRVSCRRFLKRSIHGLDGKQCAQIESEVFSILTDPQLKFLFVGETSAEVPIVGTLHGSEGLQSVAGQVDRLVISKHEILIVDYKSNQSPPKSLSDVPELYLRQMATYRAVLSKIWQDRPVRCALLWTDGPYLMYLDDG